MVSGLTNATLGPTLFGAEVLRTLAAEKRSAELRWLSQDKAYILRFSGGRPSGYVAPSGQTSVDLATVRKVLRAFAVATEGFIQVAPVDPGTPLAIDVLGEALVAVLHGMPEHAVTEILAARAERQYRAGGRYDAIASAITQSRGPMLPKPAAPVGLGAVTKSVSIEAKRAWIVLIALGAVDRTEAPKAPTAPAARPQPTGPAPASGPAAPRSKGPPAEPGSEAEKKAHLLQLQLPTDPDAVHAALDLKKRLSAMFDKSHYEVLNVARNASKDSVRTAYFELAKTYHLDRFSNVPLGEYRQVAEEVFRKISEASRVLSDDAERSNYDVFLERKEKGLPTDVNVILEADNLFQRGKMMVDRGQGANAYRDLARAVELNPVDPELQAYCAYAQYLATGSSSFEEVRNTLQEILKKEERNGKAHDFLGRVFRAEGNLKAAAIHLQKAVEIAPKNADAQRELRVVQMRLNKQTDDNKGGFLKGLLKR